MLTKYTKGEIKDLYNTDTGIKLEVNWNPEDPKTNECKIIKITPPDGKSIFVRKEEFLSFLWLIGNSKEHMRMIPQKIITKRRFEGLVRMTATKDIHKGEEIVTKCFHDLPDFEEEVIGELKRKGAIITPKVV